MLFRADQKHKIKKLERYRKFLKEEVYQEIISIADELKGLKVVHLNATPKGGGVSEILKYLVPLMKGVGIDAEWRVIPPNPEFFAVTKQIHNALQGKEYSFSEQEKRVYLEYNKRIAEWMNDSGTDILIVHDPQPLALIDSIPEKRGMISIIHIDTSSPNEEIRRFLIPFAQQYRRVVFSVSDFILPGLDRKNVLVFPPAIEPFSAKNRPIRLQSAKTILQGLEIDTSRPLVTQVSRFDPWKDPMGVVDAYRIAKQEIPDLQLALVGLFLAQDDPEGISVLNQVKAHAGEDKDIFLFHDVSQIGPLKVDTFVNIFQVSSDVVIQKSIREGFALTVSEAMWKRKAVIGGNVGGIKLQIEHGKNGYLVETPIEAAKRIVELIKNPRKREQMGRQARKRVKDRFLMPRLLLDYLKMFREIKSED